jgi:hypothetical protein
MVKEYRWMIFIGAPDHGGEWLPVVGPISLADDEEE